MTDVFVATLGQRPEAITVALDALMDSVHIHRSIIIHTDPRAANLADAYASLKSVLDTDYSIPVEWREVRHADGRPLSEITTREAAEGYFKHLYNTLRELKQHCTVYLLVSSGRKPMSIYATLAASALFGHADRVWVVLSPDHVIAPGKFHIKSRERRHVQLVDLPLVAARFAPGMAPENVEEFLTLRRDARTLFMVKLSDEERNVVETLMKHPYSTNGQLALVLGKSPRTIDNQLSSVYGKLVAFLDSGEHVKDKKRLLVDFLRNSG